MSEYQTPAQVAVNQELEQMKLVGRTLNHVVGILNDWSLTKKDDSSILKSVSEYLNSLSTLDVLTAIQERK